MLTAFTFSIFKDFLKFIFPNNFFFLIPHAIVLYISCISFKKSLWVLTDIEKTMVTLDNVLGYYHVAKEVEEFIKEGFTFSLLLIMLL